MLDTGLWILDFKGIFLSSIKHPATSISIIIAGKLINAHKLVDLRRSFAGTQ